MSSDAMQPVDTHGSSTLYSVLVLQAEQVIGLAKSPLTPQMPSMYAHT